MIFMGFFSHSEPGEAQEETRTSGNISNQGRCLSGLKERIKIGFPWAAEAGC
jgi:hypothetical protein